VILISTTQPNSILLILNILFRGQPTVELLYANISNKALSYFSVIYSIILRDKKYGLSVNMIATKIMPTLIPHTMNPGLNLEQFQTLIEVLQDMLEQIDR